MGKDEKIFNKLCDDLIEIHKNINCKEDYDKLKKDDKIEKYLYINKIYSIRPGLYNVRKKADNSKFETMKECDILKFLRTENVKISNNDGLEIFNTYKNNKKALIFLDPPYMGADNDCYGNPSFQIYEELSINDITKYKSFIVVCIYYFWISKLLFSKYEHIKYEKIYQTTKKKIEHILFTNRKEKKIKKLI
jgi:hypothetical protein